MNKEKLEKKLFVPDVEKSKLERFKFCLRIVTAASIILFLSIFIENLSSVFKIRQNALLAFSANLTKENELNNQIIENIKLERYKVRWRFYSVAITVICGSGLGAFINYSIKKRKLEQQALLNEAQLRKTEMKYLGEFLTYALEDDINKRLRFADYFSKLTISNDIQDRWEKYHKSLRYLKDEEEKIEIDQKQAKTTEEKERLLKELAKLKEQTTSLSKEGVFVTFEKAQKFYGLDENMKPKIYTPNEFELQQEGKVVYDKTTKLMWQQSGSDRLYYSDAKDYIAELNIKKFAGYSDWRLPKLEEAITLLEKDKNIDGLYINPFFDRKQRWIWTSTKYSTLDTWVIYFIDGICFNDHVNNILYVRAVR